MTLLKICLPYKYSYVKTVVYYYDINYKEGSQNERMG